MTRNDAKEILAENYSDMRTAKIRTFASGATRSSAEGKPEYAGYLSPQVILAFGAYMYKHQLQPDGQLRSSRNWQKGIDRESYMQSMFRHFVEVWNLYEATKDGTLTDVGVDTIVDSLMALMFNVQGMAHELIKDHSK
jgi:hypothetical protein